MEAPLSESDVQRKIRSILLSHPNGLMPDQIKELGGFTNIDAVYRGLRTLQKQGSVQEAYPFRCVSATQ
jgi:hypothetical protein